MLYSSGWFGLWHGAVARRLDKVSVVWCWQVVVVIPELALGIEAGSATNSHVIVACVCAHESKCVLVRVRRVVIVPALVLHALAYAVRGCGAVNFWLVQSFMKSWRCGASYVLAAVVGAVPAGLFRLLHDTHAQNGSVAGVCFSHIAQVPIPRHGYVAFAVVSHEWAFVHLGSSGQRAA